MWLKQTHYEGILKFLSVKNYMSYLTYWNVSLCVVLQWAQDALDVPPLSYTLVQDGAF